MSRWVSALLVLWIAGLAQAGCEPAGCVDQDEDGFGLRCAMGADCDDTCGDHDRAVASMLLASGGAGMEGMEDPL